MADPNDVMEAMCQLDDENCAAIIVGLFQNRPELCQTVINASIPEMTFPPTTIFTHTRSHGVVKSFNAEKGFGFLDCEQLKQQFGRDVFVHKNQMRGIQTGAKVSFAVALNKDNHPQAFDITEDAVDQPVKGCSKGAKGGQGSKGSMMEAFASFAQYASSRGYDMGMGGDKGKSKGHDFSPKAVAATANAAYAPKAIAAAANAAYAKGGKGCGKDGGKQKSSGGGPDVAEELGSAEGVIKSFSETNGYGFIECVEIQKMGYKDVFLHHQQLGSFNVGDAVVFDCFVNTKGSVQAKNLRAPGADKAAGRGPAGGPDVQATLGEFEGIVKSFNAEKGYGFIDCPQIKEQGYKDVFVHHAQMGSFQVGENVQFTAFLNNKGNVQGMDLQAAGSSSKKRKR